MPNKVVKAAIGAFGILLFGFSLYSYSQVEPNLVLSNRPFFWQGQQLAWALGYSQRFWSSLIFLVIGGGLFLTYGLILKAFTAGHLTTKMMVKILIGASVILGLSYPALSHDIFNYLFNAKMVLVYHANPHLRVASDFPADPWFPYLHNRHTAAPYAYGWTGLSLLPAALGMGHLKMTMLWFRLFVIGFMVLWLGAIKRLTPKGHEVWFWAVALNPLVLIETVGNIHNDVVMMALLMWAIIFAKKMNRREWWWGIVALGLWLLSVSIKYASVLVLVGVVIQWGSKLIKKHLSFGGAQAMAHFLPLLSARSQRFLAWYLIWPLSFLPLTREKIMRELLLLFSLTSFLAYLPYLMVGEYTPTGQLMRQIILWVPPLSYGLTTAVVEWRRPKTGI